MFWIRWDYYVGSETYTILLVALAALVAINEHQQASKLSEQVFRSFRAHHRTDDHSVVEHRHYYLHYFIRATNMRAVRPSMRRVSPVPYALA